MLYVKLPIIPLLNHKINIKLMGIITYIARFFTQ